MCVLGGESPACISWPQIRALTCAHTHTHTHTEPREPLGVCHRQPAGLPDQTKAKGTFSPGPEVSSGDRELARSPLPSKGEASRKPDSLLKKKKFFISLKSQTKLIRMHCNENTVPRQTVFSESSIIWGRRGGHGPHPLLAAPGCSELGAG